MDKEQQLRIPQFNGTLPQCQLYYLGGLKTNTPQTLMRMETMHIMVQFFFIGGLHILEKQQILDEKNMRQKLIEYVLSLHLRNGGFTCSTLYSKFPKESKYEQGHIVFNYSALNCLKILGALDKVDKDKVLKNIAAHQRPDGSFSSFINSTECDLRFVYSALSICKLLEDFSYIDVPKTKEYIEKCYNFDGGFGLRPRDESHCGAIFCAVASYEHLGLQFQPEKKIKIINFLVFRQIKCAQSASLIGIQGRVGKIPDSCYSFWAGASLKMLTGKNLLNPEIERFVSACFKEKQVSFGKVISSPSGDFVHTYHSILGLKILRNQSDHISMSQLLLNKILSTKNQQNNESIQV